MLRLEFDLETDGFLEVVTRVHCLVTKNADTGEIRAYHDDLNITPRHGSIVDGVRYLMTADVLIGHNIQKYDIPVLVKLFPWFVCPPIDNVRDTMVIARLIWPDTKPSDLAKVKTGFPGKLVGKHSLAAWGHRLGNYKGDYDGGWETFSQAMLDYCIQDIEVTSDLFQRIEKKNYSPAAIDLEHRVAEIISHQEQAGFRFNVEKAAKLYGVLVGRRNDLTELLKLAFAPWYVNKGEFTPKRDDKKKGYTAGVPFTKIALTLFNPASRDHIADRLIKLYGWKPQEMTDSGKVQVDEQTLAPLKYPVVKTLIEYLLVDKRIGQISEGKEAWLKKVQADGRMHGVVNPMGAVTGRMTHFWPNVAQVPKVGSPYGAECRELFEAAPGWILVGCDAAGLELRCLAHFLAKWDEGAYATAVIEGKEALQTDVHSRTCLAIGLEPQRVYTLGGKTGKGRDFAKTFIYAFLYGAGDEKLGSIVGKGSGAGRILKRNFIDKIPGMKGLRDAVQKAAKRGYLVGLDGRHLRVRSPHAALNTLLQSAGALVMKKALVLLDDDLRMAGYSRIRDYSFVANIHDEWQIEVREDIVDDIKQRAVLAIRRAGDAFGFRCPLDGTAKAGSNWKETH